MPKSKRLACFVAAILLLLVHWPSRTPGCCPAGPVGKPVVNADQTVILIWDPTTKTVHFIRQASFKSEADDFGFLIPTPAEPELSESGNAAFPYLKHLTRPETIRQRRPRGRFSFGCALDPDA